MELELLPVYTRYLKDKVWWGIIPNIQNFWIWHLIQDPPVVWTEDYQVVLMEQNFKAFDQLREMGFLIGEMIWNFADFATPQGKWYFVIVLSWLIRKVSIIHA